MHDAAGVSWCSPSFHARGQEFLSILNVRLHFLPNVFDVQRLRHRGWDERLRDHPPAGHCARTARIGAIRHVLVIEIATGRVATLADTRTETADVCGERRSTEKEVHTLVTDRRTVEQEGDVVLPKMFSSHCEALHGRLGADPSGVVACTNAVLCVIGVGE
ncbi:MAG: hypothetical protein PHZ00_06905 [Candidatus Peribacteraceae bacterium]|nr:hypothetical protein [Candidatus Peribacteraceae bacterium]